jgi:hypothetical protein
MKWISALFVLLAGTSLAQAQTMEKAFEKNCPLSVTTDEKTARLHCVCVRKQIVETTAFPEDREASFALIGPAQTLKDMNDHSDALAKLPPEMQKAILGRQHTVQMVIVPLCFLSAATGKVSPDGSIRK